MLRDKINMLINEYGVKQEAIISTIGSNRVTFGKKLKDNSFTSDEYSKLNSKYGKLF